MDVVKGRKRVGVKEKRDLIAYHGFTVKWTILLSVPHLRMLLWLY